MGKEREAYNDIHNTLLLEFRRNPDVVGIGSANLLSNVNILPLSIEHKTREYRIEDTGRSWLSIEAYRVSADVL